MQLGGLFSSQEASKANLIYAPSCSSDAWLGSAAAAPPTGLAFRGHDVVTAIFGDLVRFGMGRHDGTRVLFGGCGSGALGAMLSLDRIGALLSTLIVPSSNLRRFGALLDGGLTVEEAPLQPGGAPSLSQQAQAVFALANAQASVAPACRAAFPAPADQWRCLTGAAALEFVRGDLLLHAPQYSSLQLAPDAGAPVPDKTPEQLAYAEAFRNATRAAADAGLIGPARDGTAALLPACFMGCAALGDAFSSVATNGVTLEQALVNWWMPVHSNNDDGDGPEASAAAAQELPRGGGLRAEAGTGASAGAAKPPRPHDPPTRQYVVDDCTGFNCGRDCPSVY